MDNKHTNFSFDLTDLEKITEENLGFSALSDGLGFRPKEKKIQTSQEAPAQTELTTIFYNEPRLSSQKIESSLKKPDLFHTKENTSATVANLEVATIPQRILAMFFDTLLLLSTVICAFIWAGIDPQYEFAEYVHYVVILFSILMAGYFIISESLGGQSLGKMVFGLIIVEDDKYRKPIGFQTAFRRFVFFCGSLLPLGYGLFLSLLDSKYRTWHDRLTTSVVERKRN